LDSQTTPIGKLEVAFLLPLLGIPVQRELSAGLTAVVRVYGEQVGHYTEERHATKWIHFTRQEIKVLDSLYSAALGAVLGRLASDAEVIQAAATRTRRTGSLNSRSSEISTPGPGLIDAVQQKLVALGYLAGQPDGVAGASTRAAVQAFQKRAGLPADGEITNGLLDHLAVAANLAAVPPEKPAMRRPARAGAPTASNLPAPAQTPASDHRAAVTYRPNYRRRVAAVIGIDAYAQWPGLEGAAGDARRMAGALRQMGFDQVIELYDRNATRAGMLGLLGRTLADQIQKEDLVVIYFSGHGQTETLPNGEKRGYVIPADADRERVFETAISMDQLRDLSSRLPAKHVYYAMDSCYSGLGLVRGLAPTARGAGYIEKVTARRAVQMVTAGSEGEEAIEAGGRGLFTTKLLEALGGEADFDGDGYVTASEIGAYVKPQVTAASRDRQTPQFGTLEGSGEVVFAVAR
jgi:peptidoglycan hydrolase-like protein with peptidoglycan-binding domain